MKRLFLGTALLLLTTLVSPAAHAAYTMYTERTTLLTPQNNATYTVYYPNTTVQIPVSITNQWVNVSGNPSTIVTVQWSMVDYAAQFQNGSTIYVAHDWSNGQTQVGLDQTGRWHRNVNNNTTGNLSATFSATPGSYSFVSGSGIEDGQGNPYISTQSVNLTVNSAI